MIQFAYPRLLWLLLLIPLLLALLVYGAVRKRQGLRRFAHRSMLPLIIPEASPRRDLWRASLRVIAAALLVIALARPQLHTRVPVSERQSVGVDVAFCIDVSNSMLAEDVRPNRIGFAKQIISYAMQGLEGSRVAIIVFAGGGYIRLPLTPDLPTARTFLADIQPGMVSNQGTNIAEALNRAAQSLSAPSEAGKAVILLTDGEDHEGGIEQAVDKLKEQKVKAYVVTVGGDSPAPIPLGAEMLTDSVGRTVLSQPDASVTARIASETGGESLVGSSPRAISDKLLEQLRTLPQANLSGAGRQVEELYSIPLIIAMGLLLLGSAVMRRKSRIFSRIQLFGHHAS